MHLEELNLETFIVVLMVIGIESYGKNLKSWEILIKNIIAQIITLLVLLNMALNVKLH